MSFKQQVAALFGLIPAANGAIVENEVVEVHLHHKTHWYGIRAPQTVTQWADGATMTPYVATSGNNTWSGAGNEAQLFGTARRLVYVQRIVNGTISAERVTVDDDEEEDEIRSDPPAGKYKVTNLYVDPATGHLEVEYDDNL